MKPFLSSSTEKEFNFDFKHENNLFNEFFLAKIFGFNFYFKKFN